MKRWLMIVGISLLLIIFVYPSAFIYPKDTLPDNNDTRLIAYIIGQVQKNITEHRALYSGTFFAPEKNTLAYSDLFLTTSVITLPFRYFTASPVAIFNVALVITFLLTVLTSFLLFEYLFQDMWTTSLVTIIFNLSGFHLSYFAHLQVFSLWLFCLAVYFFLRFLKEKRRLFQNLFFLTLTMQIAESFFLAYLIFFACLFLFLSRPTKTITLKYVFQSSLPFIPFWFLLAFPYLKLHNSFPEATRPIRDAAHFSLGLEEIFTKYHSWTTTSALLTSLLLNKFFVLSSKAEGTFKTWSLIFIFSLTMSLGPVLKILGQTVKIFALPIPLPYTLFYYLFPGFNGFRTPNRFIILTLLATVIIIGYHLQPIFKTLKSKTKLIFILLVLSFIFVEADLPLKGYPVNINMHPVYEEVKALPEDAVILELPIKLWNMPDHEIESVRSLYTLEHNHRRFGGYSGFATKSWIDLVEKITANGLNPENISRLKSIGVTNVIENNKLRHLESLSP